MSALSLSDMIYIKVWLCLSTASKSQQAIGSCPQDPSFPHFPFIVHARSNALHSGSWASRFERRGFMLPTPQLHNVEFWLDYATHGYPT